MCFSDDARPPLPPISGGAANDTELELVSADGTRFAAYTARAQSPTGAGIVILPDVRGLHSFYRELAVRFAEAGLDAIAFDYFGRSAGIGPRDEGFEYRPHVEKTRPETIAADVRACIDYLRSPDGGGVESVFSVGFCFGGANSWRQGADQPDLAGVIGFYGVPARVQDAIDRIHAPVLMLVAGQDFSPVEVFQQMERQLSEKGVEVEMHVYERAPHSFFDRSYEQFAPECEDAWRRMLDFTSRHAHASSPA